MEPTQTVEAEVAAVVEPLRERAEKAIADVQKRLGPADLWLRQVAREQPMLALATAVGLGYVAGRMLRRTR